jgi:hypothetical protein
VSLLEAAPETGTKPADAARRTPRQRLNQPAIAAIAAASGLAAIAAPASPTATMLGDAAWLGLIGALVPLAAASAQRWTLLALTAIAGLTTTGRIQVTSAASLILVVATVARNRFDRRLDAAIGAVAINGLVRAEVTVGSPQLTLVLSVGGVVAVLATAYPNLEPRWQRLTRRAGAAGSCACCLMAVVAAFAVASVRSDLEQGVAEARAGLTAASTADPEGARTHFTRAEAALSRGHQRLAQPWLRPALGLPVVGPNLHATIELSESGAEVAAGARRLSEVADPRRLTINGAQVDIDALLDARPELTHARDLLLEAITTAEAVRSPWLLPPLASRLDALEGSLRDALPTTDDLVTIAEVAPSMLGADGARTYLVLFTTPSESRYLGGFVGNWGLLVADRGRLSLADAGRIGGLSNRPDHDRRTLSGPAEFLERYYRYGPTRYLQNVTATPDFPTVGQVATELYPQAGLPPLDGVILADPGAIAALLQVTGPITVPSLDTPIDSETIERYLWLDQYVLFADDDRIDILDELLRGVFSRLDTLRIDPRLIGSAFGPVVQTNRLMVWSPDPDEAALLARLGLDGAFPRLHPGGDVLSVRTANASPNKIDTFLQRDITYTATIDRDTGTLTGEVSVELHNVAVDDPTMPDIVLGNADMEMPRAWNRQWVSIYTPHQLVEMRVNGALVEAERQTELGLNTFSVYVEIPADSSFEITFKLTGHADPTRYRLQWAGQPTVRPDSLSLSVDTGSGTIGFDGTTSANLELEHPR